MKAPLLLVLAACSPTYSPSHTLCDLILGGAWGSSTEATFLTGDDLQDVEFKLLSAVRYMSDKAVKYPRNVCSKLQGVKVFTHSADRFVHPWSGGLVHGYANCSGRNLVIATPDSKRWQESSLAHELMHIAQDCSSPLPVDPGWDEEHANWNRDGFAAAIKTIEEP